MRTPPKVLGMYVSAGGGLIGAKRAGCKVLGSLESSPKDVDCLISNGITCFLYSGPEDFGAIPRSDVILFCHRGERSLKVFMDVCRGLQPRAVIVEQWAKIPRPLLDGFIEFREVLDWTSFGCPIEDKRQYVVAFRKDMPPIARFPFPEGTKARSAWEPDETPDPSLYLTEREIKSLEKRIQRNKSKDFRFGPKYLSGGTCPKFPMSFFSDRKHVLIKTSQGVRKLSPREVLNLHRMPKDWILPEAHIDAYRLASTTSPPSVLMALFEELLVWLP